MRYRNTRRSLGELVEILSLYRLVLPLKIFILPNFHSLEIEVRTRHIELCLSIDQIALIRLLYHIMIETAFTRCRHEKITTEFPCVHTKLLKFVEEFT